MSRRSLLILGLVALAAVGAAWRPWGQGGSTTAAQPNTIGGLTIDSALLETGELWATGEQTIRLPVRNTTNHRVHILGFHKSCNCVSVRPESLTIQPGEEQVIEVRVDTAPKDPSQVGRDAILREYPISPIVSGQTESRRYWTVKRLIRSPISTDIPAVLFGESNRKGEPPVSRTVRVRTQIPGTLAASIEPPLARLELIASEEPGVWFLKVTPRTELDPGAFRSVINLALPASDAFPTGYELKLPVDGVLVGVDQ